MSTDEQVDWVGEAPPMMTGGVIPSAQMAVEDRAIMRPESRIERVFIEFMGPSLNSIYAGVHWSERKKQADAGHLAVSLVKIKPFDKPVTLTFQPVAGKRDRIRDCSNYSYAAKIIEDGLVKTGVLEDDSPEFVKGFGIDEPVIDRARYSGMWVLIKEVDCAS